MTPLQLGELAALATAVLWTLSTLAWTSAGQRLGSLPVSFHRLLITCVMLSAWGGLGRGQWLPTDADGRTWLLLGVSGLLGFLVCDLCAFQALLLIGPRLTLLLFSLSPPAAAVISWALLGEVLQTQQWLGMAVTLAGVGWVVAERRSSVEAVLAPKHQMTGVLLGVAGALAQAVSMILARQGIGQYDAAAATLIRVLAAMPGYIVLTTILGRWSTIAGALRDVPAMTTVAAGSLVGPILGVTLSMIALRHCPAGIVATIIATMPVLVLPFSVLWYRDHVSLRAALGAVLSVVGVGLMCWESR